jgi:glycosyltransferase involved in cell wall biosynthesis
MKITLLHPSRGRAEKAKQTYDFWKEQSSGRINIEHILSIDDDDVSTQKYINTFRDSLVLLNPNTSVVEATNKAAEVATGDILIYFSDDFKCPKDWDILLLNYFNGSQKPILLKVDDCLQKFEVKVLTIPIMNKELYNKLGYFWHPNYKSMFVDEDLWHVCNENGFMVYAPELKFPHEHPCNGKAKDDETYKRSAANWDQGKEAFAKRKLEGFAI